MRRHLEIVFKIWCKELKKVCDCIIATLLRKKETARRGLLMVSDPCGLYQVFQNKIEKTIALITPSKISLRKIQSHVNIQCVGMHVCKYLNDTYPSDIGTNRTIYIKSVIQNEWFINSVLPRELYLFTRNHHNILCWQTQSGWERIGWCFQKWRSLCKTR